MTQPHNIEAEYGLLGGLLKDNRAFDRIEGLKPEHFYYPAHSRIYAAIEEKINAGLLADPVTLKAKFDADFDLDHIGGEKYLQDLTSSVISIVNTADYCETIKEAHQRRQILDAAEAIRSLGLIGEGNLLPEVERIITGISTSDDFKIHTTDEAARDAFQWMRDIASGKIKPALTGIRDIDRKIKGLFPCGLYVVAARPGMGKTALALSMAGNICRTMPSLFFSAEMGRQEIIQRLLATRTGISISAQREPHTLSEAQWTALEAAQKILPRTLYIDDKPAPELSRLRAIARRFKRKNPSFVMFVDYLGLMKMNTEQRNRVHQIEEITTGLKALAKELEIPIVLLCQLNRAVETRDDQRPGLSDLRDSGSIEQDADCVMFIYREEYYEQRKEPKKKAGYSDQKYTQELNDWHTHLASIRGNAEIIFGKNRQGELGSAIIKFDGIRQRFE